jgi:hypothetical protein
MATLSVTNPNLLDLARLQDPDGTIAKVAEILNQTNEILDDMTVVTGNQTGGHKFTVRSGLPAPTWRKLNGGVQPNKGRTAQAEATCGMLEAYSEVDKKLVELSEDAAAFRLSEDRAHIEGMNQEMATTMFFGNEATDPEKFTGLAKHYAATTDGNGENIILGGGSGTDNTSIWLVCWSPETIFGIVPKGSQAGLQFQNLGEVTAENIDGANGRAQVMRSHYTWDLGLCVKDWRYAVRIPNIDKSGLLSVTYTAGAFAAGTADLADLMFRAMAMIPNLSMGRAAFYGSRATWTALRRQLSAKVQNSTLTAEMVGGKFVEKFQGIPIRRCDALAADEALVA